MSIPDELRNIRDHLRSGRFGQREVWEQQLKKAADNAENIVERLRDKSRQDDLDLAERLLREAADEIKRLQEQVATLQALRELDRVMIAELRAALEPKP